MLHTNGIIFPSNRFNHMYTLSTNLPETKTFSFFFEGGGGGGGGGGERAIWYSV